MRLDELLEIFAPDFFFALGEDDDVHRELSARREVRLDRLDVQIELAFVVDGAARQNFSVANRRVERRRLPELERFGGLHVVVTINEQRRLARCTAPLTD